MWKYVEVKNLSEAENFEKVCALYPSPIKNTSGKKTDENMKKAEKDAKEGKCRLLIWREVKEENEEVNHYFYLVLNTYTYKARYSHGKYSSVESLKRDLDQDEKLLKVWEVKGEVKI